jgi:hypothetical protein
MPMIDITYPHDTISTEARIARAHELTVVLLLTPTEVTR